MENKIKFIDKLTVKNINKTFATIIFVLVFLLTFLWGFVQEFKENPVIFWPIAAALVALVGITWLALVLIVRHRAKAKDINQQKISQALDKLEEQAKAEQESKII